MGIFGDIIEVLGESLEAYNADMAEMAKAKETYNRLAKKYGKPVIGNDEHHRNEQEPMMFTDWADAHRFLKSCGYEYENVALWKKGKIVARGRKISCNEYVVTFHNIL